jgi:riboflavin kinase/FMN adenylyltransferase
MEIIEVTSGPAELAKVRKGCVLTIGNFDGVHIGHQEILAAARQTAARRAVELVVMTFEPHPLAVLHTGKNFGILTPLALKKHLLAELGVDCFVVVKSTRRLLALSPQDFVHRFLVENIQPAVVVEGRSFNFGSGRTGSVHLLQELGTEHGFEVIVVDAKEVKTSTGQNVPVSSTIIRDLLKAGSVSNAVGALGRPYRLIGQVIPGRGKGKELGFPTANMQPPGQLIPAEGVYAGFVEIGDSFEDVCIAKHRLPAVFSIGRSQTLADEHSLLIEAHLLIEDIGQLYDKWFAMDFIERIRDQQKFKTEAQLSAQIAKDCGKAEEILRRK